MAESAISPPVWTAAAFLFYFNFKLRFLSIERCYGNGCVSFLDCFYFARCGYAGYFLIAALIRNLIAGSILWKLHFNLEGLLFLKIYFRLIPVW